MTICVASLLVGDLGHGHHLVSFPCRPLEVLVGMSLSLSYNLHFPEQCSRKTPATKFWLIFFVGPMPTKQPRPCGPFPTEETLWWTYQIEPPSPPLQDNDAQNLLRSSSRPNDNTSNVNMMPTKSDHPLPLEKGMHLTRPIKLSPRPSKENGTPNKPSPRTFKPNHPNKHMFSLFVCFFFFSFFVLFLLLFEPL